MTDRFIVFDTETPNHRNDRMSAIGITVVEHGQITEEFYSLVNPETEFDWFNIRLTGITPEDYAVIMTRGHQGDFVVLEQMLRTEATYIGVIGSRHKIAATNARLLAAGIPEEALARIHTPIGLAIGAETPAEIAISVAAELIAHRAGIRKGE